jgi:hypothetical protein
MKRKSSEISAPAPQPNEVPTSSLSLSNYLTRFKRTKKNDDASSNNASGNERIKIRLKDQAQVDKGFYNLTKEVIEEAFADLHNVHFLSKSDTGRGIFYYDCAKNGCSYRIKLTENLDLIKSLQTNSLISSYKNFDVSNCSELKDGISFITEYGEHLNNHPKDDIKVEFSRQGTNFSTLLADFISRNLPSSKACYHFRKILSLQPQKLPCQTPKAE